MKCPINEITDDLTRNMAWDLFNHIEYEGLCKLYNEPFFFGRIGAAITAAKTKKEILLEGSLSWTQTKQ